MKFDSEILESAILDSARKSVFRLYGWYPKCISLGRNQKGDFISSIENIDVVRRLTGGRALLHDDEITYSFVSPIDVIPDGQSVVSSYKYISGILIDFFKTLGVNLDLGGSSSREDVKPSMKNDYCMLISTGADVCYKGKKIIGSAQYRKNGYLLQHGSILFSYDKNLLKEIFNEEIPEGSITCMNEILPDISKEIFVSMLETFITKI